MIHDLSTLELAYCIAVLLFTFALRGSVGFGGAVGLPLLALVIPVKVLLVVRESHRGVDVI